jgi:anti-anti-sigma factor
MESAVAVVTVMRESFSPTPSAGARQKPTRARLSVSRVRSCTVVAVVGDIDAGNAEDITACVTGLLGSRKQLLLDLSGLEFLGVAGTSALEQISGHCAQRGIAWVLIPSAAVSRTLDVCDATDTLPTAHTAAVGLHLLSRSPCRHLQLV